MIAVIAPNAPEKTGNVISSYGARYVGFLGSFVLCTAMLALLWFVRLASANPVRDKAWITCAVITFLVAWWFVAWGFPTRKYRRFVREGCIIEVRNPDIIAFLKDYWGPIDASIAEFRTAEVERQRSVIAELNLHAETAPDFVHQRIEQERARLTSHKVS